MSFSKSKKFSQYVRLILPGGLNLTSSKNYITNRKLKKPWNVTQKLSIILPIGVGISVISFIQWSNKNDLPYDINDSTMTESASNLVMQCYYYLPWRVTSRMIGWLSSIEIPQKFRPFVYNKYAELFGVNLDEIDCDINLFPSLSDFFARPLKSNARPIAMNANIVSPADGTILYLGPILTSQVKRVKGISYSLRHFLGDTKSHKSKKEFTDQDNDDYVKSILKNSNNSLYQLTVYLAPGDYHRFHSATEWKIRLRRHFQGKLLSVNPRIFNWFPHLLEINERAVYIGDWREGFMAYAAVGATNVGSIRVYCDNTLRTNTKWKKEDNRQDFHFIPTKIAKGEMFGEFRLGSTIVILFEAPKNFCFSAKVGQSIKMGEALTTIPTECDYVNKITINLNRSILYALNLLGFC